MQHECSKVGNANPDLEMKHVSDKPSWHEQRTVHVVLKFKKKARSKHAGHKPCVEQP